MDERKSSQGQTAPPDNPLPCKGPPAFPQTPVLGTRDGREEKKE